jgi:4-amino-4-deoxy-L-arabinose transferase-like glycosyltransferase
LHSSLTRFFPTLAFIVCAWALFSHLGDFPLLSPDEGRNAEVAREMKDAGAWLVPTYDGATYLDKPAFFFKAVALSLAALGDNEAAARLPSALFAFGLLAMLFSFCRRVYDGTTAALAILIVATTPLYLAFARIVIFDMTLAFFVCGAILSAYLAEEHEGRYRSRWYLVATLCAGIATLVKGPVGFLVPFLVVAAFHLVTGRAVAIKRFFAPLNILLFLAVVLPWFVGLSLACPDFPYYGIMKESIARFTTTEFRRTQPFYYYGLIIASCFFGWSLILPEAAIKTWRERGRLTRPDRLFIVWALVVVVFFSLSQSKLPGYILTGMVALGVLVARVFAEALHDSASPAAAILRRASLTLAVVALPISVALALAAFKPGFTGTLTWLKPEIPARFGPVFPNLALTFGLVTLCAGLAGLSRDVRGIFCGFLTVPLCILTLGFDLLPRHASIRSARPLVEQLPASLPADTEFACINCLPHGLPFYLGKMVTVFTDDGRELTSNYVIFSLASNTPWPEHLVPGRQLTQWLATRQHPVYLMARQQRLNDLQALARQQGAAVNVLSSDYWGSLLNPIQGR